MEGMLWRGDSPYPANQAIKKQSPGGSPGNPGTIEVGSASAKHAGIRFPARHARDIRQGIGI